MNEPNAPGPDQGTAPDNAAEVQPDFGGQGQSASQGLYDLASVPEHLREHVTPILKDIEGNVTRRFQQYSDQVKSWEPYAQLGINEVDPQELAELLEFRQIVQDQDAFKQWYDHVGQELGYGQQQSDADEFDLDGLDGGGLSEQRIQELVQEQLQQHITPLQQYQQEQQWNMQVQAEHDAIEAELDALGIEDKNERTAVLTWAYPYGDDPDSIKKGHADYQRFVGNVESRFVNQKAKAPGPAISGGVADTQAKPITSYGDAREAALEMIRKARSS